MLCTRTQETSDIHSVRLNRLLLHCQWKDGIKCGWLFCVCGTNTWNFICIIASRAYWTSWILNTNLYSWRYIIRYVSVSFARSTIHSEVQIILWDLCSSISSFFFVSTIVIVVCVPFLFSDFVASLPSWINCLLDNQHRHIHNSCVRLLSQFTRIISLWIFIAIFSIFGI